jgi:hypothetical protein
MERFVIFAWQTGEAEGGWSDFQASFNTAIAALDHADTNKELAYNDNIQIVDTETGIVVVQSIEGESWDYHESWPGIRGSNPPES